MPASMHDQANPFVETALSGYELLNNPLLNKGTAFTDAERDAFDLHGLLPPHVAELDYQVRRRHDAFRGLASDLQCYVFLRGLQDSNETLFYALLTRNIEEMMPIVYTPTVGLGCELFSRIFRKPRGLFLSIPHRHLIRRILSHPRYDRIDAIVVSDGERILGVGDQGAGGMGIPIGKLSLYTACAGLHPATTLPVILDAGTDNKDHLRDPLYIGWQHERVRGADYDNLVSIFVEAVRERWPHVLLHWEDFAIGNANRLLARYRDCLCTFNDDIQGTAAIAVGTLLSAINITGVPLREQRVAVLGAGSAGTGICALLSRAMIESGLSEKRALENFYLVDRPGLLLQGMTGLQPFQAPFAQAPDRVAGWTLNAPGRIGLDDVVANAHPTVLIGTSGQAGRARHGRPRKAAGDFSIVQPDRPQRGNAGGARCLDRRTRGHRHRQPVSAATARRQGIPRRPEQQCLCLSGHWARRDRGARAAYFRWHVSGRGQDDRRTIAGQA
jgi:malate dehydrogenase (oxaloacetate-decarboxylating)